MSYGTAGTPFSSSVSDARSPLIRNLRHGSPIPPETSYRVSTEVSVYWLTCDVLTGSS